MKTTPKELGEAASVDGAGVVRQFFQVVLPLTRPALAPLATLEFTWLYNDFFWGAVLLNQGRERPITSSIAVLNGQYATDFNLIAAASIMIAVPTLVVYLALQKQFISELTLGASNGEGRWRRPSVSSGRRARHFTSDRFACRAVKAPGGTPRGGRRTREGGRWFARKFLAKCKGLA